MRRAVLALIVFLPLAAEATPHDLPFSYPYATLGQGQLEIEQYADLTPVPLNNAAATNTDVLSIVLTTEIEYGITDRLEAGFYLQGSNFTGSNDIGNGSVPGRIDGIKERLRYRIADPGSLPIDVSIYGEVSEFQNEIEFEAKINLEKRIGRLEFLVNLWAEREFYFVGQQEWVLNPTAGVSFQLTPAIHLGLEYWGHGEYGVAGSAQAFNAQFHSYLGPALMMQTGRVWMAVAPYVGLDQFNHAPAAGDLYGPLWVRTIVGIEF